MRRKQQTKGYIDGKTKVSQLGWVSEDRLEADVQQERQHFGELARRDGMAHPIKAVESTDELLVVFYEEAGMYLMIQWIKERDETS